MFVNCWREKNAGKSALTNPAESCKMGTMIMKYRRVFPMTFTPRFPVFLHGGDYNPDQWLDRPDILDRDVEMMHKAHVNTVSNRHFLLGSPGA